MTDKQKFVDFMKSVKINERTALKLWDSEICDARDLVSYEKDELAELTKDRTLLNTIFPVLKPNALDITLASDCNEQAYRCVMQKLSQQPEPMDQDGIESDATPSAGSQANYTPPRSQTTAASPPPQQTNGFVTTGAQNNSSKPSLTNTINFSGVNNFSQAVIGGSGPVTFDNRNAKITMSTLSGAEARKQFVEPSMFKMKGSSFMSGDLTFLDDGEFWIDGINVAGVTKDVFKDRLKDSQVYPIHTWGKSRALLINNYTFTDKRFNRNGGERDTENMKSLLEQLGFRVNVQTNKKAAEIKQLLTEFSRSKENMGIGMTMVFIGSHGERAEGKDYFLGTDHTRVCVDEVSNYFTEKNCVLLKGKPKLFMFQFCRLAAKSATTKEEKPPTQESGLQSDASPFMDDFDDIEKPLGFLAFQPQSVSSDAGPFNSPPNAPPSGTTVERESPMQQPIQELRSDLNNPLFYKDMHFSFSTAPGTKSYRDRKDGTWFVTCVVKVFSKHAHKDDYASMLTTVNREVLAKKGSEGRAKENGGIAVQLCQSQPYLDKKVFFFPKGK